MKLEAKLSDLEMRVLLLVRERAAVYSDADFIPISEIATALGANQADVRRAASFLGGFELVGSPRGRGASRLRADYVTTVKGKLNYFGVYLTAVGENYLRTVEAESGFAHITLQAWEQVKGTVMSIAQTALTEIVKATIAAGVQGKLG